MEIVDPATGEPCRAGEFGEIVLTTFASEAMPLIRYRTGDIGRIVSGPCGCGSTLPRLGRVRGRMDSEIPVAGGGTVSIHQLDEVVFAIPEVRGFEATLRRGTHHDTLILTVDALGRLDQPAMASALPAHVDLEVRYAPAASLSLGRKRRIAIEPPPAVTPPP